MTARVEVPVTNERAELVAAALWARGALGVWERPGLLTAWFSTSSMTEDGTLPLTPPTAATAATAETAQATARTGATETGGAGAVPELLPDRVRWSREPDRDWQEEWKATIAPVRAGRAVVVPSWLADEHRTAADELTLVLDPGQAFGSGHHATTTLCLELLDDLDRATGLRGRTVADIGCGTGVLAIAAARWGAAATAVDIDPIAVEVTRDNAARNNVELDTFTGSVTDLAQPAEIVVANLVTDVIVSLAQPLVAATTSALIVSGIATLRQQVALEALEAAGAQVAEVRERNGWVAARLIPPPATPKDAQSATTGAGVATSAGAAPNAETDAAAGMAADMAADTATDATTLHDGRSAAASVATGRGR